MMVVDIGKYVWNEAEKKCYWETLSEGNRAGSRARVSQFLQANSFAEGTCAPQP